MKNHLLASVALPAFLAGSAMAADLPYKAPPPPPPPAVFSWTGFYAGLNLGGAWGRSDVATNPNCGAVLPAGFFTYFCGPGFGQANAAAVAAAGSGSINSSGITGGAQVGYNLQSGNVVYGVEADAEAFRLMGSRQGGGTFPVFTGVFPVGTPFTMTSSVSTNWLVTVRGRVGWAFGDVLAYATGGLAVTDLSVNNTYVENVAGPNTGSGAWGSSATKLGWTVGGGFEWAWSRNWSAKAEYLYLDFGSVTASGMIVNPAGGAGNPNGYANAISTSTDLTAHIARAGVNFRF